MSAIHVAVERGNEAHQNDCRVIVTFSGRKPFEGVIVNLIGDRSPGMRAVHGSEIQDARNAHFDGLVTAAVWQREKAYPGMVYVFDATGVSLGPVRVEVSGWCRRLIEGSADA